MRLWDASSFLLGTLRGRLILGVAAVHAVMMTLFIFDTTARQRDLLLAHQEEEAVALSRSLSTSAAGWLAADDISGLQELVEAQRRYPELVFAILADQGGRILAHTDRSRIGQSLRDLPGAAQEAVLSRSSGLVDAAAPAFLGGGQVGWARVGVGQKAASERLTRIALNGALYAAAAIVIGSAMAWLMGRQITMRLYAVQDTIGEVRAGNRAARSTIAGTDEAASIAREFNVMLDARDEQESALARSETRYRQLLRNIQAAVIVHGADTRILMSNPKATELLGLTEEQLLGKATIDPAWQFLREDGSPMPLDEYPVSRVLAARRPFHDLVLGVRRPDRERPTWVLVSANLASDSQGAVTEVIVTFIDVTERKLAEAARAHLAAIVESSSDAIIGKSLDGVIQSWNTGAEKTYGYTAAETIGRSVAMLAPPGLEREAVALVDRIRGGEEVVRHETVRVRKDGQLIHVALTLSPIRGAAGEVVGVSTIARDVTERKRAEQQLARLHAELEQRVLDRTALLEAANKELDAFAYSVSHDLRAPLRHIGGFIELLQQRVGPGLDPQAGHFLAVIAEAAHGMGCMIDDLLAFSRMGRAELVRATVDVGALVREVIAELAPDAAGRTVDWKVGAFPPVSADRQMLRLALANLLSNAVKFTRTRTRAEIEVACTAPAGDAEVVLSVRDNGVGFDMRYVDKLFKVFQRLHRAEEFEGTGIGLANVRRIVERHGGRTWAEGTPGQGATFYFSLPTQRGPP